MKATIIGLFATVLIVGCGGGSSAGQSVCGDGSNTGNTKNQYGYFGGSTKFCKYSAARDWALVDMHGEEVLLLRLLDDGEYGITDGNIVRSGDYGISSDKMTIKSDKMNDISILKVKKDYYKREGYSAVDCYEISGGDRDILMCPNPKGYGSMKTKLGRVHSSKINMFGLFNAQK